MGSNQNYKTKIRHSSQKKISQPHSAILNKLFKSHLIFKIYISKIIKMYIVSQTPSYSYRPRSARHNIFEMMPFFDEPIMEMARPRRHFRPNWVNFEDLLPWRHINRSNPFQKMEHMIESIEKNWNQPNLKIEKPENLKIKIDQDKNLISIGYEDDHTFYESTRSLPKYIQENKMHQDIKCQILDGQVKMIFPEKPEVKTVENQQPRMIEITPEIRGSEEKPEEEKATENSKTEEAENLEVEVVNE